MTKLPQKYFFTWKPNMQVIKTCKWSWSLTFCARATTWFEQQLCDTLQVLEGLGEETPSSILGISSWMPSDLAAIAVNVSDWRAVYEINTISLGDFELLFVTKRMIEPSYIYKGHSVIFDKLYIINFIFFYCFKF